MMLKCIDCVFTNKIYQTVFFTIYYGTISNKKCPETEHRQMPPTGL